MILALLGCAVCTADPWDAVAVEVKSRPPVVVEPCADVSGDLYAVPGPPGPLVVALHGGGWTSGTEDDAAILLPKADLVGRGIGFLSLAYPLADGTVLLADQVDAADCAVAWARGEGYGPVTLLGTSAGGHIAALAAQDEAPDGLVMWYAPVTVEDQRRSMWRLLLGTGTPTADQFVAASPWYAPSPVATLVVHGDADTTAPYADVLVYVAGAADAELVTVHGAGHGWTGTTRATRAEIITETGEWVGGR